MSRQDPTYERQWIRAVVERYQRQLVRYAARITGDLERGRDVVQDTFLRLCREHRTKVDGHLVEWLFTVCRNQALDVRRKEKRMEPLWAEQVTDSEGQAIAVENRDSFQRVCLLLEGLPENQQEVVRLKFQAGLSYREISGITGLSISNVGYLLHVAIRDLRRGLHVDEGPTVTRGASAGDNDDGRT